MSDIALLHTNLIGARVEFFHPPWTRERHDHGPYAGGTIRAMVMLNGALYYMLELDRDFKHGPAVGRTGDIVTIPHDTGDGNHPVIRIIAFARGVGATR